ncbi:hypothetical protein ACPPVT_06500 [Angustibacter sp. McL0619]|uniref:hypothetical protein n=1 Tax=Angustibacter sp. McL0619 TaxID=3415676 RepID=UPI003CF4D664
MPREPREREDDGEIVVRAVVHARLLGLRILSLDARVVVGRAPLSLTACDATTMATAEPGHSPTPAPRAVHNDGASVANLINAARLLADGHETLERSRRLSARTAEEAQSLMWKA